MKIISAHFCVKNIQAVENALYMNVEKNNKTFCPDIVLKKVIVHKEPCIIKV